MKPRTKIQIAVDYLQSYLKSITKEQQSYAFENIFDKSCYRTKNTAFCLECGESINTELIGKKKSISCPVCKSKLKIQNSAKRTENTSYYYFGVAEVIKYADYHFQVIRTFELAKYSRKGEKVKYYFNEVCQNWYEEKGKHIIYSKLDTHSSFQGDLEIRTQSYWKKYNPFIVCYCPTSIFQEKYTKYGINHKLIGSLEKVYYQAKNTPHAETLLKANYHKVLHAFHDYQISEYWQALKICLRHKYKIKEADIYRDYLQLLKELKKDLSNPTIICPKNLHTEHNKVLEIVERKRTKEQAKRNKETAIKQAIEDIEALKKFQVEKEKFFNLEINGDGIKIIPLKSIDDFMHEAETHKHCVLTSKYYKKKDSLIMKALVNNQSVETIEFSLKDMQVIQSRGLNNKASKHHENILKLINTNTHKILKIHAQA